jgi:hypothetical protein
MVHGLFKHHDIVRIGDRQACYIYISLTITNLNCIVVAIPAQADLLMAVAEKVL